MMNPGTHTDRGEAGPLMAINQGADSGRHSHIWVSAVISLIFISIFDIVYCCYPLLTFQMDVFEYRTTRSFNTDGVFVTTNTDSEIGGLFLRLKNRMVTKLHLQWDIAFLEQYNKEHMVPRGLCWDVHPQQGDWNLEPWFRYLNELGIKFLSFLVDKKQLRRSIIDKGIKDLTDKLTPFKTMSEYIFLSTNLKNHLEKEDRDQRTKKTKEIKLRCERL